MDAQESRPGVRVRHKTTGKIYTVIGTTELQTGAPDGAYLTIYEDDRAKWWALQENLLEDGVFEYLDPALSSD